MLLNPYRFAVAAGPPGRYWVGGTNTWNSTAGTKWATTSGGAGGATAPIATDDVYFDASSGSGTVTVGSAVNFKSIDFTGFVGTLAGTSQLTANSGSATFSPTMTLTWTGLLRFAGGGLGLTLNSGGKTLNRVTGQFSSGSDSLVLMSNLNVTAAFTFALGTFHANGFNITADQYVWGNSSVRTINLGSGTITATSATDGMNMWSFGAGTNLTFNAGTSQIDVSPTGTGIRLWDSYGRTYNNVRFTASPCQINFHGNNTYNGEFRVDPAASGGRTLLFESNLTQNFGGTVNINGTAGNLITMNRKDASGVFTFNRSAGGAVAVGFCNITNSAATPGSTWTANSSVDGGGNTGWTINA